MNQLSVPTPARLPSSLRINPSSSIVRRSIARLSRQSLISLALSWLDPHNGTLSAPFLRTPTRRFGRDGRGNDYDNAGDDDDNADDNGDDDDDEYVDFDDFYPPARSREELRQLYLDMETQKGSRKDVADRITQGDWRHGLSLYQLAMVDIQHIFDHPASLKWSAHRLVMLKSTLTPDDHGNDHGNDNGNGNGDILMEPDDDSLAIPRLHPSTFLQRLQDQILPDIKAHFHFDRPSNQRLLLLRIFVLDSPYNTALALSDPTDPIARVGHDLKSAHALYIAFPDASPFVYISKGPVLGPVAATSDTRRTRSLIISAVPKALSGPGRRYVLESTSLASRNLEVLLEVRGPTRTNSAAAGWSYYTSPQDGDSPLDPLLLLLPTPPPPPLQSDISSFGQNGDPEDDIVHGDLHAASAGSAAKRRRTANPAPSSGAGAGTGAGAEDRLKRLAQARFGNSGRIDDGKGLERLDVIMEDAFPSSSPILSIGSEDVLHRAVVAIANDDERLLANVAETANATEVDDSTTDRTVRDPTTPWTPGIRMIFHGSHIFAGVRQLVEMGAISGERMPGWLTGEDGIAIGAIRHGRLRGHKKSNT